MKFLLPLLALIPVAMGQDPVPFVLNTPVLSPPDPTRPLIDVQYTSTRPDPISGNTNPIAMGTTLRGYRKTCVGEYRNGAAIDPGSRIVGITDDYDPATSIGSPPLFQTNFRITVDPSKVPEDIFSPGDRGIISFCLIIGLETIETTPILVDFTETLVTIGFDLVDNSITAFTFTAVTEAAYRYDNLQDIVINTLTIPCIEPGKPTANGGIVTPQGSKVCFEVCVDNTNQVGPGQDWRVSSLHDVVASGLFILTDPTSLITQPLAATNQLVTWWGADGTCFKVVFHPNAAYYKYQPGNVVTVNGLAKMSRLIDATAPPTPTRLLRHMEHRALSNLETAESDFEMQIELEGGGEGSAGISIKQITFAAGIAGVALLV